MGYSVLMPLAPWEPPSQVAAALQSLIDQSMPPEQVVVSCDGAPPEALAAVLDATSLPLELVVGPGGEGVGPVLARGLQVCTQELVVRADADDLSLPERCEIQVAAMEANPFLVVLSTPILEFIHSPQAPCGLRAVPSSTALLQRHSRWSNPLNHPAVILRRQEVLAAGNYRDCPGFEDYELWLRLLHQGALLDNLNQPLVLARVGDDHLARRRGATYVRKEWRFLVGCGRAGTLSWPRVALLLILRTPIRLLPAALQKRLTQRMLRLRPPGEASHLRGF
jgi:hypothetical protein